MTKLMRMISVLTIVCMALAMTTGCACWRKGGEEAAMPTTEVTAPAEPVETPPAVAPVSESELEAQAKAAGALHTIYFAFDKYNLEPASTAKLDRTAQWLSQNPNVNIAIEGNCDERGTNEYNLALGERRADAAKRYLVNLGVAEGRVSTVSYGEEKPADPGHDEAAWAKNRRDEFKIAQ